MTQLTPDDGAPLDPDVFGSGLLSDTIDAYRDRIRDLEAEIRDLRAAIVDKDAKIAELLKVAPYRREWE